VLRIHNIRIRIQYSQKIGSCSGSSIPKLWILIRIQYSKNMESWSGSSIPKKLDPDPDPVRYSKKMDPDSKARIRIQYSKNIGSWFYGSNAAFCRKVGTVWEIVFDFRMVSTSCMQLLTSY
jgi:hypothetical protein